LSSKCPASNCQDGSVRTVINAILHVRVHTQLHESSRIKAAGWGSAAFAARYQQEPVGRALHDYLDQTCDVLLHLVSDGCTRPCSCRPANYQLHHQATRVGTKQSAEKPMTCSNAWACLTKRLKALDTYSGQSGYSTRRGNMFHQ